MLPLQLSKKKKMSALYALCDNCKEDDINMKEELDYLNVLFLDFNLKSMGYFPFEVEEAISLRRDYFSTFVFYSRKQ